MRVYVTGMHILLLHPAHTWLELLMSGATGKVIQLREEKSASSYGSTGWDCFLNIFMLVPHWGGFACFLGGTFLLVFWGIFAIFFFSFFFLSFSFFFSFFLFFFFFQYILQNIFKMIHIGKQGC